VYIGGGTPSLLSAAQFEYLFRILNDNFDLTAARECTVEANPEDVSLPRAEIFQSAGCTRVSLGAQSFQEKYLQFLGRKHSAGQTRAAFAVLRQAGFKNINLDLMFDFPSQTTAELKADLRAATKLGGEHISIYSLTVEPNSRFYAQKIKPPAEDIQAANYELIIRELAAAGLKQYEISNFARPGEESAHNLNYWQAGNYIGLGVAAHSHENGVRRWNTANLEEYIRLLAGGKSPESGREKLSASERLGEALVFGLRLNSGAAVKQMEKRLGVDLPPEKHARIQEFIAAGFLEYSGSDLRATVRGRKVLDELAVYLI